MATKPQEAYDIARERYAALGVDTEQALATLQGVGISLPCWQGDDVRGFESPDAALSGGGIQATGDRPGRARNADELRADLEKALSLLPGDHRVNLHAMYGEFGGRPVDRDAVSKEHFAGWIDWARERTLGLDFNATLFSHPRADAGFTLSSPDAGTRAFWIEHVLRCRRIAESMGRSLHTPCVHNLWIPDGMKDVPADRRGFRERLESSLDTIFDQKRDPASMKDAVESKLFGLGAESFTVGSHEFYLGYALSRGLMVCLDLGHFHPTESVADKISSILLFSDALLLHLSRPVRWDSDHVTILDDALEETAREVVQNGLDRVHLALDFFDASINRPGAWVIGARAACKAILGALLEPSARLRSLEAEGDYFRRLALFEALKTLPLGAVWEEHCRRNEVPGDEGWIDEIARYDHEVLQQRS